MYTKIQSVLNKIAQYLNLNETQKNEFLLNVNQGLMFNLINDGQNIVSTEILEKLKENPNDENLRIYFQELIKDEEKVEKIFSNRMMELLEEILVPVTPNLTSEQKAEILKILGSENNDASVIE